MGLPLDQIPGFREAMAAAQAQEDAQRDIAFLELCADLCGEPVRPLTLRMLLWLFTAGSPFVSGGSVGPEHVAQFLWIASPSFAPFDTAARAAFVARVAETVPFEPAVEAIDQLIDAALMDRPARSGRPATASITSFAAGLVDEFASEYGWTRGEILDCPVAILYQQLRRIDRRHNPKALFFNRITDRVRRELVAAYRKTTGKDAAK